MFIYCIMYSVASEEKGGLGGEGRRRNKKGGNLGTSRDFNVVW